MRSGSSATSPCSCGVILPLLLISAFAFATLERNYAWSVPLSLWRDAVLRSPHKARPNYELGMAYSSRGMIEPAFQYLEKAWALDPAAVVKGVASTSEVRETVTPYREAIDRYKNDCARMSDRSGTPLSRVDPTHQMVLVSSLLAQGEYEQALVLTESALRSDPENTEAYLVLAGIHRHFGRQDKERETHLMAIARGNAVLRKADAYVSLGIIYGKQGKYQESVAMLKEAVKIKPSYAAHYCLSVTYNKMGMREEAVREYQAALIFKHYYGEN